MRRFVALLLAVVWLAAIPVYAEPENLGLWKSDFPKTDFARTSVPLDEIRDDGNFRDTIQPISSPQFQSVSELTAVGPLEPVLSLRINGDARAYPLRILLWHEIVNDVVGGVPILVSYCPLCNSGVVYDRRLGGEVLDFGNTGRLRHFDMVMYDHQSESWWQQFTGEAIVGDRSGETLRIVPARLESLAKFRQRAPDGKLLVPNNVMAIPTARPLMWAWIRNGTPSPAPCCASAIPTICRRVCRLCSGWWWSAKKPGAWNCYARAGVSKSAI